MTDHSVIIGITSPAYFALGGVCSTEALRSALGLSGCLPASVMFIPTGLEGHRAEDSGRGPSTEKKCASTCIWSCTDTAEHLSYRKTLLLLLCFFLLSHKNTSILLTEYPPQRWSAVLELSGTTEPVQSWAPRDVLASGSPLCTKSLVIVLKPWGTKDHGKYRLRCL